MNDAARLFANTARQIDRRSGRAVKLLRSAPMARQTPDDYVYTNEKGKPGDQSEFDRGFQSVLLTFFTNGNVRRKPSAEVLIRRKL